MKHMRLGDLLVRSGAITEEQLENALKESKAEGKRLGAYLIESGTVKEMQIINALVAQLGIEYIDLNSCDIPADMAKVLPKSLARKYKCVPVKLTRTEVYLAMTDPLDFLAIEEVEAATRHRVIPMITTEAAAGRAVMNLYSNQGAVRAIEEMRRDMMNSPTTVSLSNTAGTI